MTDTGHSPITDSLTSLLSEAMLKTENKTYNNNNNPTVSHLHLCKLLMVSEMTCLKDFMYWYLLWGTEGLPLDLPGRLVEEEGE